MTPRALILSTVADTLGLIPEAVHDLTPLPRHNPDADTNDRCDRCRLIKALGIKDGSEVYDARTVGDLVRFIEARESEVRG